MLRGWQHYMDQKERIHLVVNEEKRIPFDTLEAGPGTFFNVYCLFIYEYFFILHCKYFYKYLLSVVFSCNY